MPADWTLRATPDALTARYEDEGLWSPESLGTIVERSLGNNAEAAFAVWSDTRPYRGTLGDVHTLARRVAGGLRQRGVGPGDVVAFQLPNWMEAAAVFWGVSLVGATLVPIVHFYGPKEVRYILGDAGPRVLVTADRFGYLDYVANLDELLEDARSVEHVFVVGDDPGRHSAFEELAGEPVTEPPAIDPSSAAIVAYTSGTTADPKGVVHSHRSIAAEMRQLGDLEGSGKHPMLVGAPVGHAIGMLSGLLVPLYRDHPIHLIDTWDPTRVLSVMAAEQLNAGSGATFFLQSLLDHPDCGPEHLELMERVGLGGMPVPPSFAERAASLGISIVRSFGCTEHPSITGSRHEEPAEKRMYTDGHPLSGVELRLVDDDGNEVQAGEPGEIWSRGPDLCAGYTNADLTRQAFTDDGWFRTGDIGVVDGDGYLTITDRKSDVIIRGGENISAAEVEEQLLRMPGIADVAVVAAPDERLGEHACAFVRLEPGADVPNVEDVRTHLEAAGLARQKWPEEIRAVEDFERTPSGKIKKYVLRAELAAGAPAEERG